jgi:diacylglycerol kinase (ATP)
MKKEFVIKETKGFSFGDRLRSFRFALEGLFQFFSGQHNAFIHLFFTLAVFAAAIFFRISRMEFAAVIIAAGFVWAAELFNTAVENLADKITTEFDPKIKLIKDVSAAAVLISAGSAALVGMIIFLPKILP